MQATNFKESNQVIGPPKGVSEDDVQSINAWAGPMPPENWPVMITCWKPSKEELQEVIDTGRVWLHVYGHVMPPVSVSGHHPFVGQENEH